MTLLLVFAVALLVAVLLSEMADRSVLSTAVLFLAAGFLLGPAVGGVLPAAGADDDLVRGLAELALFSVLLTDGMRSGGRELRSAWRLPGRALLLGMPLVFALTTLAGWAITGVTLAEAALLGAVLAPTDPVFASAIIGRGEVPARLRHLLNVESGINDGLALPVVLVLLSVLGGHHTSAVDLVTELAFGIALGIAVPWIAIHLEASRWFAAHVSHRVMLVVAIGVLIFASAQLLHANLFLAAYAAGVTIATVGPQLATAFHEIGELAAELLKLAALLVFGASISPQFIAEIPWTGWVFALVTLVLVRPVAVQLAFLGSALDQPERIVAGWFGPKGFASVVYGLLVADSGISAADTLFHLIALVVVASILAHSSTDVAVARWFGRTEEQSPSAEVRGLGSGHGAAQQRNDTSGTGDR